MAVVERTPAALLRLQRPLVLASASPRRAELLRLLGVEFAIEPSGIAEPEEMPGSTPEQYVQQLALSKAAAVAQRLQREAFVLAADTTVVLGAALLNKPHTPEQALQMLQQLSGGVHEVYTGVALMWVPERRSECRVVRTRVRFRKLSAEEIAAYVESGLPLDKAGGYGIQDPFGAVFVDWLEGCYYNVVGLPLATVYELLRLAADEPR